MKPGKISSRQLADLEREKTAGWAAEYRKREPEEALVRFWVSRDWKDYCSFVGHAIDDGVAFQEAVKFADRERIKVHRLPANVIPFWPHHYRKCRR